jgi:hypothetical protein
MNKGIQTPIILKGRAEKRTIWLHSEYVRQTCAISPNHNRKNISIGQKADAKIWKCEKIEGVWYFQYDFIPSRKPLCYQSKFPTESELMIQSRLAIANEDMDGYIKSKIQKQVATKINQEDVNYYQFNQGYSLETAIQLAEAKAWMEWISHTIEDRNYIDYGIESKMDVYKYCVEILSEKQIKGIKLSNISALRNKIAVFPRRASLEDRRLHFVHKGKGNDNANVVNKNLIVNEETGEVYAISLHLTLIYSLYMNLGAGNKNYKMVMHQEYMTMMMDMGYERMISYNTFCRYTNEWEGKVKLGLEREGKKSFNNKYLPYVSAEPLRMRHSLWGGDGSSTKLYFNDKGTMRSLMCYRIADIASRKIIGYSIYKGGRDQKGESEEIVLAALEMAYKSTGLFAAELITDNGGCAGTKEFRQKMEKLFGKFTTISPGNSQENPTETIVKAMNNFGRRYKNWGGSSFNATQDENMNNPDYMSVSELPTEGEAIQQAIEWIEGWNSEQKAADYSPNELYEALESNPLAKEPINQAFRFVFGKTTQVDLSYQRGFVNVEYMGMEQKFTIPNFEDNMRVLSQRTGMKGTIDVIVKWHENNADLYNLDLEYILTCERTNKTHKSYSEATEDSWKNHGEQVNRKLAVIESAEKKVSEVAEAMSYLNMAKTNKGNIKDSYNEQMEEEFNERMNHNKVALPVKKKAERVEERARMNLI